MLLNELYPVDQTTTKRMKTRVFLVRGRGRYPLKATLARPEVAVICNVASRRSSDLRTLEPPHLLDAKAAGLEVPINGRSQSLLEMLTADPDRGLS